jgi:hypothetical protein
MMGLEKAAKTNESFLTTNGERTAFMLGWQAYRDRLKRRAQMIRDVGDAIANAAALIMEDAVNQIDGGNVE